jgi:hypothetical protein
MPLIDDGPRSQRPVLTCFLEGAGKRLHTRKALARVLLQRSLDYPFDGGREGNSYEILRG